MDKQHNKQADETIESLLLMPASMIQPETTTWQENVSQTKSHKTNNNKVQQSKKDRLK